MVEEKNGLMKTDLFQRKQSLFLRVSSTSLNLSSLFQKSGFMFQTSDSLVSRRRFQIRIVDVRSPQEYTGEITSPPEYPTEHAQRPGHIPGAQNITLGTGSKRGWHIQIC